MKKALSTLIAALALAGLLAACSTTESSTPAGSETSAATETITSVPAPIAAGEGATITDRAGNTLTLPEAVDSIISMSPATTQVLIDLGLTGKLVGVDTDSAWMFPEVADLPAFELYSPDLEQLMVLAPDLLFTSNMSTEGGDDPFTPLRDDGLCVAEVPTPATLSGVLEDVAFIAACVGEEEKGAALIEAAQGTIDEVAAIAATIEDKRTVLFEISALPYIYSFGTGVYLNEVVELIGAENILAGEAGWLPVTEEAAVAADPDVILTNVNYIEDPVAEILGRDGWQAMQAVENGDVYLIDNAASSLPNHHVVEAIVQVAKAIYPEAYAGL